MTCLGFDWCTIRQRLCSSMVELPTFWSMMLQGGNSAVYRVRRDRYPYGSLGEEIAAAVKNHNREGRSLSGFGALGHWLVRPVLSREKRDRYPHALRNDPTGFVRVAAW